MHYTLKDHQGSLTATIHGNTVERLSYDAWGRRRNPNGFGYSNVTHTFDRGYTLHEHYDPDGLINMNGRMYDPVMSSFLSVDRYVQQPGNSQGFNRYAYCMYNPLRYVDPTGWVMSRPNGVGTNPPNGKGSGGAKVNGVPVPSSIDTMGECAWYLFLREVVITDYAIPTSGGSSNGSSGWSSDRGYGNPDLGGEGPYFSEYKNYEGCGASGGGNRISFDYNKTTNINITVQSLNLGNGLKTEILDASVRYNYKTGRTRYQWEYKLTAQQQSWRLVNTLGKEGSAYLRVSKLAGKSCTSLSVGIDFVQMADYYNNGGKDNSVYAKGTLDIAMGVVSLFGPIGFGISMTYFIIDIATDGFYGWGRIPRGDMP